MLFGDGVPSSPGFGLGPFAGIRLEEAIEVLLVAPPPAKVVVAELARRQIGDHRILPAGQLHDQALDFAAEEPGLALDGLGQRQTLARGPDGGGVPDLGLDDDDVGHEWFS